MGHQVWVIAEIFADNVHPDLIHIPVKVNWATSATRNRSFNQNAQKAAHQLSADQVIALSLCYPSDASRVSDASPLLLDGPPLPRKNPLLHRTTQSAAPRHLKIGMRDHVAPKHPHHCHELQTLKKADRAILRLPPRPHSRHLKWRRL